MSFLERFLGGHHGRSGGHGDGHHGRGHNDDRRHVSGPDRMAAPPMQASGIACPGCGSAAKPGARFCPKCGGSLAQSVCGDCSSRLQPGDRFCAQCGRAAT